MAGPVALSFHVYRLARPTLDLSPPLRFDAAAFAPDDGGAHPPFHPPSPRDALTDPLGALEAASGALAVPAAVGTAYLGEPFVAVLALAATPSSAGASDVAYRAELAAPDGTRSVLAEGAVERVAPGGRSGAVLKADVRAVGRHALVLTGAYTDGGTGERRHVSAHFAFVAAAPLAVRTKVRRDPACDGAGALVEATVESLRRASPLCISLASFEASPGLTATRVGAGDAPPRALPPGGATSFLFRVAAPPGATGLPPDLGRLDLRWSTPFGGVGRLQTQGVAAPPPPVAGAADGGGARLTLTSAPSPAPLAAPFAVTVTAAGAGVGDGRRLRVEAPPAADGGSIVVVGPRALPLGGGADGGGATADFTLVALAPGVHRAPALRLVAEGEGGGEARALAVLSAALVVADT